MENLLFAPKDEDIVKDVISDYLKRKENRRAVEIDWLQNINFLVGNQYVNILPSGESFIDEPENAYESKEVFNHIAPIVESRLAKLNKVKPSVAVRPASPSEKDREIARVTKAVIDACSDDMNLSSLIKEATVWSEVTGTGFYKVSVSGSDNGFSVKKESEESEGGATLREIEVGVKNKIVCEGEQDEGVKVNVSVVSPFEIYPSSESASSIDELKSIIHARAIPVSDAERIYNLSGLKGETIKSMTLDFGTAGSKRSSFNRTSVIEVDNEDFVLVIERYTKCGANGSPTLEIVVGDRLVYNGEMPFGVYPFVRQISSLNLGSFWGASIITRCIPVQRAYNAVKNRKIDYLSRLTTGVVCVEEGSVDVDDFVYDGLKPGKVVVYRSGSASPRLMDTPSLPPELSREEDRLLNELITLTGVSELMRNSMLPNSVTSGTAINLLTEADDNRLSVPAENIRNSALVLIKLILKIFKNVVSEERISRLYDERGKVQLFYWKGTDLRSEDIVLDTENELSSGITSRRQMVLDLLKMGLFNGENGKIDAKDKAKILEMIGFGNYEASADLTEMHLTRAREENLSGDFLVLEVDDHEAHIVEHTKLVLDLARANENDEKCERAIMHIREHKAFMRVGRMKDASI